MTMLAAVYRFPAKWRTAALAACAGALAGATCLAPTVVLAQADAGAAAYPSKPVHVVVTLSAGSATDIVARVVLDPVGRDLGGSTNLGQAIVFENRTGAGGTIGANAVAKADPDGYTLLVNSNAHTIAPAVIAHMPYDVLSDFTNITTLGAAPHVLIISPAQGIKTLAELVAAVRQRPGGLVYGAVAGTAPHLNAEHFRKAYAIDGRVVSFKGAPEAITEVVANRIDVYFCAILPALPFIQDKQLVGLAVTSRHRSPALPDVPTSFELGYADSEFGLWFGLYAPARTPAAIVDKIYAAVARSLADDKVRARLEQMGVEPRAMPPAEFDAYVRRQVAVDGDLARAAGMSKQ